MPVALPEGSWALILGGSSGFGLATAHQLSRHGVNLCIVHPDRRGAMRRIEPEFESIRERGVIHLLCLPEAAWVNGEVIRADGGEHVSGVSQ